MRFKSLVQTLFEQVAFSGLFPAIDNCSPSKVGALILQGGIRTFAASPGTCLGDRGSAVFPPATDEAQVRRCRRNADASLLSRIAWPRRNRKRDLRALA